MSPGFNGEAIDAAVQDRVEQLGERRIRVRSRLDEAPLERVGLEHADLLVEAVEERDVPRLVRDLRAQEDAHIFVGNGAHDWTELGRDTLLTDEERAEP